MTSNTAADDLRWAVSVLAAHGERGRQMAQRISDYLAARGELTLDRALGVSPGLGECPWWIAEARSRRDILIVEIATRFSPNEPSTRRCATMIVQRLERYASGAWTRDRIWRTAPEKYAGKVEALLFSILKLRLPVSVRTVQRILAAACVPLGCSSTGTAEPASLDHEKHEHYPPQTAAA